MTTGRDVVGVGGGGGGAVVVVGGTVAGVEGAPGPGEGDAGAESVVVLVVVDVAEVLFVAGRVGTPPPGCSPATRTPSHAVAPAAPTAATPVR